MAHSRRSRGYDPDLVKRIFVPFNLGIGACRHLAWYVSYQVTGETREPQRGPATGTHVPLAP
jgi:hypothetical protein